jgi:hypothetical protein
MWAFVHASCIHIHENMCLFHGTSIHQKLGQSNASANTGADENMISCDQPWHQKINSITWIMNYCSRFIRPWTLFTRANGSESYLVHIHNELLLSVGSPLPAMNLIRKPLDRPRVVQVGSVRVWNLRFVHEIRLPTGDDR